jgi:6-pyruvoyltetrahydropterin/6-carboxytetrahydropterin synthase
MFELSVEKTFAAAHFLRDFTGPCERLHGHNYRVVAYVRGTQLDAAGMLVDFTDLKASLGGVLERLDHYCLNDLPEFAEVSPSAENIARFIAEGMAKNDFGAARLDRVEVWETPIQSATYFLPDRHGRP